LSIDLEKLKFIKLEIKKYFTFRYLKEFDELYICDKDNEIVIKGIWGKLIQDVFLGLSDLQDIYEYFLNHYDLPIDQFLKDMNRLIKILENNDLILLINDHDLLRR